MKKGAIIGIAIIALCVSFLVSLSANTSTYATFNEASKEAREFHVMGFWDKTKPTAYDAAKDANRFEFYMKDEKGETKQVIYNSTKPQDFEKSEKLVLIGEMKNNVFYCNKILMKCPSKYNNNMVEINAEGKAIEHKEMGK